MEKNEEFAGVDEKYIPEDQKNVDESLLGSKEESKEKTSKVAKTIIIGFICFGVIVLALVIGIVFFVFSTFNTASNLVDDAMEDVVRISDRLNENGNVFSDDKNVILNQANEQMVQNFNDDFEIYNGTKSKLTIVSLLDKVVTNNKTEKQHIITVKYNETISNKPDDIVKIKHSLETTKRYEVSLDYDKNGYINQVTISDI